MTNPAASSDQMIRVEVRRIIFRTGVDCEMTSDRTLFQKFPATPSNQHDRNCCQQHSHSRFRDRRQIRLQHNRPKADSRCSTRCVVAQKQKIRQNIRIDRAGKRGIVTECTGQHLHATLEQSITVTLNPQSIALLRPPCWSSHPRQTETEANPLRLNSIGPEPQLNTAQVCRQQRQTESRSIRIQRVIL